MWTSAGAMEPVRAAAGILCSVTRSRTSAKSGLLVKMNPTFWRTKGNNFAIFLLPFSTSSRMTGRMTVFFPTSMTQPNSRNLIRTRESWSDPTLSIPTTRTDLNSLIALVKAARKRDLRCLRRRPAGILITTLTFFAPPFAALPPFAGAAFASAFGGLWKRRRGRKGKGEWG
jgi:hypothetical protein